VTLTERDIDGVAIERFEIVDEFLERLVRADDASGGRRFLFRGVPDANLPLLPSALRARTAAIDGASAFL
jgi:hypothetical protein